MNDAVKMALEALTDIRTSIECAAGCDEGIDPMAAVSEIMSAYGTAMASAYSRAADMVNILAALEQAGEPVADERENLAGEQGEQCERCQGNGEIVTDWDRYMHAHDGDVGDEAVADCPDCSGTGRIEGEAPLPTLQRLGQEFDAGEAKEQIARIISLAKGQPERGQASVGAWWWDARHDRALPEHFEGECRDEDRKHADEMMSLLRSVFVGDALAAIEDVGEPVTRPIWNKACVGREGYCSSDLQDAALSAIGDGLKRGFNDGWLAAHKRLNFGYRAEDIQSDWDAYALAHPPQSRVAAEPVGLREAEAIAGHAVARIDNFLAKFGGFEAYASLAENGTTTGWSQLRSTIWRAVKDAIITTPSQPDPQSREPSLTVDDAWQDLIDKDDRTSPEEYPDMALITREELADYMQSVQSRGQAFDCELPLKFDPRDAKRWWEENMRESKFVSARLAGDGYVKFQWRDADESGDYSVPWTRIALWLAALSSAKRGEIGDV